VDARPPLLVIYNPTREVVARAMAFSASRTDLHSETGQAKCDVFLVFSERPDIPLIDSLEQLAADGIHAQTILVKCGRSADIDYDLLRCLQRTNSRLMLCENADTLIDQLHARDIVLLESRIELVQKFRVDIDFLLTLPCRRHSPGDAVELFRFLADNHVRAASFQYTLPLKWLGLQPQHTRQGDSSRAFFSALFDLWSAHTGSPIVDDVYSLAMRLDNARSGSWPPSGSHNNGVLYCFDGQRRYDNIDGACPEMDSACEVEGGCLRQKGQHLCNTSCEYFSICGGDMYGAKYAFNGTVVSSHNQYCLSVAIPFFDRFLRG
jgi:hypothetical protein